MTFLTQHLDLSIFYPILGQNNPASFRVKLKMNPFPPCVCEMCLLPSRYECLAVPAALQMSHYVVVSNMSYSMFVIGMRHLMKLSPSPSVWFSSHSLFQDSMHSDLVSYLHCISGYRQLVT